MNKQLTAIIEKEDDGYIALCSEVDVAVFKSISQPGSRTRNSAKPQQLNQQQRLMQNFQN